MPLKHGSIVNYDGRDGVAPLAFFLKGDPSGKADIAVMDENGVWTIAKQAGRDDKGGGHTFRPA